MDVKKVLMVRLLLLLASLSCTDFIFADNVNPIVLIEEDVYAHTDANNGSSPMWCHGSTCLVRVGDRLFASGRETIPDARPLNNCRWMLFQRESAGWKRVAVDAEGRTREPSPMAGFADGRVFLSVNPTLDPLAKSGPAMPDVLQFDADNPFAPPESLEPQWQGKPSFTEHSYRSFAADSKAGELLLFQNVGYTHAEWTFRDSAGKWSSRGQLRWPQGDQFKSPDPIRVCYPNVALRDREVHFMGVSDIIEPNQQWREFKRSLTGQEWDYDFRRLFYTWTPDIANRPFVKWVEIATRDETAGKIFPGDLWLASDGDSHLLWSERAIDDRLREKFFPDAVQRESLNYAVVRAGKIIRRSTVFEATETTQSFAGPTGRFHVTPDNRLFVVYLTSSADTDGKTVSENRIVEILPDGTLGRTIRIPFRRAFTEFFTTTVRAGSPSSWTLEMLGEREGVPGTIGYAKVSLHRSP